MALNSINTNVGAMVALQALSIANAAPSMLLQLFRF